MAYQPNPNDPFRPSLSDEQINRQTRLDNELQVDPELEEGPASNGRIAMYALAAALVLGAVFYGLNNTSINPAGTGQTATGPANQSTAQTSQPSPPQAPAGMRDVTPRNSNTDSGTTVGAAPAKPMSPPAAGPTGSEVDRSGSPTPEPTTK